MSAAGGWVLAIAGGVGGAKLAAGLQHIREENLVVAVNTADDFEHLGLHVSPDLDTVMYTLGGVANRAQGWGLEGESWSFMDQLSRLGGPVWFKLGDRDLATHVLRTRRLAEGATLTQVTRELCRAFGVRAEILPMSDDKVRTIVHTADAEIAFQEYFVRLACAPAVRRLEFRGAREASISEALRRRRSVAPPAAIVLCPSNPYLSIDPMLELPEFRDWLRSCGAPVIAVSPIVAGMAIKGPAAKIMGELGHEPSARTVAQHYRGLVDGFVIDTSDAALKHEIEALGMQVRIENTIMKTDAERVALAQQCLEFASALRSR